MSFSRDRSSYLDITSYFRLRCIGGRSFTVRGDFTSCSK